MLFESDSEAEKEHTFVINEHYAKAFEYKKEREELQKLKDKYGSDVEEDEGESSTDSESLESEDEDGEELTPAMDAAILRTLARIKNKDPEIYDADKDVFEEERQKITSPAFSKTVKKDKSKPVTLRQAALEAALAPTSRSPSPEPLTHVQEQAALRKETIDAFKNAISDDDDKVASDDDFLVPRSKTKDEIEKEEEEYRQFLEREVGADLKGLVTIDAEEVPQEDDDVQPIQPEGKQKRKKKKKSKDISTPAKSKEEEDQEFLLNYILNRGWIDRESKRVPTYGEVTKSSRSKGKGKGKEGEASEESDGDGDLDATRHSDLEGEDEFDDIVDRFESSYNFRFEEPDAAVIQAFPRNIASTVRREDTTRKDARARKKQRKEEELQKKREEVKRLKALKMKDIRAKLERIGKEGGTDLENTQALQELDLEGEWDPDAHDQQMANLYDGGDDDLDEEKPHWDEDIDIGDIPFDDEPAPSTGNKKKKKKSKKMDDVDYDDGAVDVDKMDAEVEQDEEVWDGTEEMRKRKLDEYMDEVYGLEFNDLVGDLPTRFKYVPVQPESFALTPVEILMATDPELNEFMSIKRYAPYKTGAKKWDKNRNEKLKELRGKITERMGKDYIGSGDREAGDRTADGPAKKRKGKKERLRLKALAEAEDKEAVDTVAKDVKQQGKGKTRRRPDEDEEDDNDVHEDSKDNEIPAMKKRRKHKRQAKAE